MEERQEVMQVEAPAGPVCQVAPPDERATPVVLTFLRETKVGRVITLAPPNEKWEEELGRIGLWPEEGGVRMERERKADQARPKNVHLICLF